jgi:hypothetical protein
LKRSMTSLLKTTQHSGYSSNDARVKSRSLLEIYTSLRNHRLREYRKADDLADKGYLRNRRQVWDGNPGGRNKCLKWRSGDHMLVALPYHSETSTLPIGDLAKIGFSKGSSSKPLSEDRFVAQVSAGLQDFATPNAPGMKAILGKELGFAAATCTFIRNGVLSVEFLDGDVLGGVPAEYGGLIHVSSADFEALEERHLANQLAARLEVLRLQRADEEPQAKKHKQAKKHTQSLGGDADESSTSATGASLLPGTSPYADLIYNLSPPSPGGSLGPTAQVAAVMNDLSALVADANGSEGGDSDPGAPESDAGVQDGGKEAVASSDPDVAHDIEVDANLDDDDDDAEATASADLEETRGSESDADADDDDEPETTASAHLEEAHDSESDADEEDDDEDDDDDDDDEPETAASADLEVAHDIESDADAEDDDDGNDSSDEAEEIDASTRDVEFNPNVESLSSQADDSGVGVSSDSGSDEDDVGA